MRLRSNSNHIGIFFYILFLVFSFLLVRSSMLVQACICACVWNKTIYMNRAYAPSFARLFALSPSLLPCSPPLSSMSMLTNCTYPILPWCEGHRTHTYTYTQQWRSSLFSHHVFFSSFSQSSFFWVMLCLRE